MPSTSVPLSCCTGGHGGQAWWPWSPWQSLGPFFMYQALPWPCGHMSTWRHSAGAHSSALWVGVCPCPCPCPQPFTQLPFCPLPSTILIAPQRASSLSWPREAPLVSLLRCEVAQPPCWWPRELQAVWFGAEPASWVLLTPTGQLHGLKIGRPLQKRIEKCLWLQLAWPHWFRFLADGTTCLPREFKDHPLGHQAEEPAASPVPHRRLRTLGSDGAAPHSLQLRPTGSRALSSPCQGGLPPSVCSLLNPWRK